MLKKGKIAIALALTRRNASPVFCALLPQVPVLFIQVTAVI
jgi:ATP-dependent DNA helicase 2 subunit 1